VKLKVRKLDIESGGLMVVLLNRSDADDLGIHSSDRVVITERKTFSAIVDITRTVVKKGEIGMFTGVDIKDGTVVLVEAAERPVAIDFIKKRLLGHTLNRDEIGQIVKDIVDNKLNSIELSYFVSSAYVKSFSDDETVSLAKAIVQNGEQIKLDRHPIVDKHCIGGVPGNRTTMVVVPILAAAGLTIPKTSSRAITSPAGTADTMQVMADVEFSIDELKRIVMKTGACMVWGGAVGLAPADDRIIRVRYPLRLDPESFLVASILAKKKSVGAEIVLIDIPVGPGAKVKEMGEAKKLAHRFIEIGRRMGMEVECAITPGESPIGRGIGPALEAKDVLEVLSGKGPVDLMEKSLSLAGVGLELSKKTPRGTGYEMAKDIVKSGKAMNKMKEIIKEQGGNPKIKIKDLPIGNKKEAFKAKERGKIVGFYNNAISIIARAAGAPKDKGAGLVLHHNIGDLVKKGDSLFTIYSENESKLDDAIKAAERYDAVKVERPVLGIVRLGGS
jgi:AMP phosphorylase